MPTITCTDGRRKSGFSLFSAFIAASACFAGPAIAAVPLPDVQPLPYIDGTPETRSIPFLAWPDDLSQHGYVEEEYLLSGNANIYDYITPEGPSADFEVITADIPYVTRMLVRRPADSEDFNGSVMLEILNATAQYDGAPMWDIMYRTIIEQRGAWVGITYDEQAADFLRDKWGTTTSPAPSTAAPRNNSRYASIDVQTWGLTWDMFMQGAALLKSTDPSNPFVAQNVERVILGGYSQSASLVKTFAINFHELAVNGDTHLVDGYYSGDGGSQARVLRQVGRRVIAIDDPRNVYNTAAPVIAFFNPAGDTTGNTPDNTPVQEYVRTYQLAGGSHVDQTLFDLGGRLSMHQFGVGAEEPDCGLPLNPLPISHTMGALLVALDEWIRDDLPPPDSKFVERDIDGRVLLDPDRNPVGGVRHPDLQVPLGAYLPQNQYPPGVDPFDPETWGDWQLVVCTIFGGYEAFDQAEVEYRYPFKHSYVAAVERAVSRSIADGFLLPADGNQLVAEARASSVGAETSSNSGSSSAFSPLSLGGLMLLALLRSRRRTR